MQFEIETKEKLFHAQIDLETFADISTNLISNSRIPQLSDDRVTNNCTFPLEMLTFRNLNRLFCFHDVNVVYLVCYLQCSNFVRSIGIWAHLLKRSTNVLGLPNDFSNNLIEVCINRSLFIQFFDIINKPFQGWTNRNSRKFESIFPKNLSFEYYSFLSFMQLRESQEISRRRNNLRLKKWSETH